jgi:hypothetical protein
VVENVDRAIRRMRRSILVELVFFNRRVGGDKDAFVLLTTLRCFSETEEKHAFSAAISELLQQGIVIGVPQPGGQLAVRLNLAKRAEVNEELARRERNADHPGVLFAYCLGIIAASVVLIAAMVWSAQSVRIKSPHCANNCVTDFSANRR